MASYQIRPGERLLDQGMRAALERRAHELIGIALLGLATLFALMLGSYAPGDPGWMVATDAPVGNLLGRYGAAIASTLVTLVGRASWAVPLILAVWGLRFVLHRGAARVLGRSVFAVPAIAIASAYASTLAVPEGWGHAFRLGGMFGDTAAATLLGLFPGPAGAGLTLLSLVSFAVTLTAMAIVCGFDRSEVLAVGRATLIALFVTGSLLARLGARALAGGLSGAIALGGRAANAITARRTTSRYDEAARAAPGIVARPAARVGRAAHIPGAEPEERERAPRRNPPPVIRHESGRTARHADDVAQRQPAGASDDPRMPLHAALPGAVPAGAPAPAPIADPPERAGGLLGRLRRGTRRETAPPPAATETPPVHDLSPLAAQDRVRARIADAIRTRAGAAGVIARSGTALAAAASAATPRSGAGPDLSLRAVEPPLVRPRGPRPLIADTRPGTLPPEPPLTAARNIRAQVPLRAQDPADGMLTDEDDGFDEFGRPLAGPAVPDTTTLSEGEGRKPVVRPAAGPRIALSSRAREEAQPPLRFADSAPATFELPPLSLLSSPDPRAHVRLSNEALEENARMLESVLDDYGVRGEITSVRPGPVVTMYELEPAPGLKASRVIGLADDIARSMSALSARVSTVPGRSVIGIELPNDKREMVLLREILSSREFGDTQMRLPLALGKDIGGGAVIANLARMPHLLIAGTTGSGKSVAINTMILSLLYKLTPEECRLIMIDPKMLELSVYDGIPHLLSPVVTDPKKAVVALKWVVGEMEERYRKMSRMGVRNIEGYNGRVREALAAGEMFRRTIQTGFDDETGDPVFETEEFAPELFPYIVVIVDEMADLMMVAGKEIEACIQRLAQMARASGIHLIMATQRPSVDVITGTIKANFPTRISFQVTSKIDSRTILGEQGAEQLLGQGDMLYMGNGARISRVHGPFVSDEEVEEVVAHLKSFGPPEYVGSVVEGPDGESASEIDSVLGLSSGEGDDALYDQAVAIVGRDRKCSTSYIQRKLGIGYNKAARLVEQMEDQGIVTPANHVGKREILIPEMQG